MQGKKNLKCMIIVTHSLSEGNVVHVNHNRVSMVPGQSYSGAVMQMSNLDYVHCEMCLYFLFFYLPVRCVAAKFLSSLLFLCSKQFIYVFIYVLMFLLWITMELCLGHQQLLFHVIFWAAFQIELMHNPTYPPSWFLFKDLIEKTWNIWKWYECSLGRQLAYKS